MEPYAGSMHDANQGPETAPAPAAPLETPSSWPGTPPEPTPRSEFGAPVAVPEPGPRAPRPALGFWLAAVAIGGIGGLLLGQTELAVFSILAGLFAVAHSADLDESRRYLYYTLAWTVPLTGAAVFASLAVVLWREEMAAPLRALGAGFAAAGAVIALATLLPPVSRALARALFRAAQPSHALRLAGRLAVLGALFYVPASLAFPGLIEGFVKGAGTLLGRSSLWGNLAGLTLLALGGVGFRVRRGFAATLERLGLRRIEPAHWAVAGLGVLGLVVLNGGAEWLERAWFPALWASDQRVNQLIAGGLSRWDALLLGLSAGVGEEIALRGAMQPRLGVLRTSALFALLHVQYSWFGVVIIVLLGFLLGTIRQRTSTTVAMLVHAAYDTLAVLTLKP